MMIKAIRIRWLNLYVGFMSMACFSLNVAPLS
jgi:hypothetical protein